MDGANLFVNVDSTPEHNNARFLPAQSIGISPKFMGDWMNVVAIGHLVIGMVENASFKKNTHISKFKIKKTFFSNL